MTKYSIGELVSLPPFYKDLVKYDAHAFLAHTTDTGYNLVVFSRDPHRTETKFAFPLNAETAKLIPKDFDKRDWWCAWFEKLNERKSPVCDCGAACAVYFYKIICYNKACKHYSAKKSKNPFSRGWIFNDEAPVEAPTFTEAVADPMPYVQVGEDVQSGLRRLVQAIEGHDYAPSTLTTQYPTLLVDGEELIVTNDDESP